MTFKDFFLANLPEKVAQEAIENTDEDIKTLPVRFGYTTPLGCAFIQDFTEEGWEYWKRWDDVLLSKANSGTLIFQLVV